MSNILEKPIEDKYIKNPKAGIKSSVYKKRLHNLNLLKALISTNNQIFQHLNEEQRVIQPKELEKLSGEKIDVLIKNIILETNVAQSEPAHGKQDNSKNLVIP